MMGQTAPAGQYFLPGLFFYGLVCANRILQSQIIEAQIKIDAAACVVGLCHSSRNQKAGYAFFATATCHPSFNVSTEGRGSIPGNRSLKTFAQDSKFEAQISYVSDNESQGVAPLTVGLARWHTTVVFADVVDFFFLQCDVHRWIALEEESGHAEAVPVETLDFGDVGLLDALKKRAKPTVARAKGLAKFELLVVH